MHDLREQIAALEAEIKHLSEWAERCRKIIVLAKMGAVAGGLLLAALMVVLFRLDAMLLVVAITAGLGGIALFGSSQSTLDMVVRRCGPRIIDGLELHTTDTR